MLEINKLCVSYGERQVLHEVSLQVNPGELLAIIGPNGAGKSTLVRAISGVLPSRAGQVRIAGQEVSRLPAARRARLLAVVPQGVQLPPAYTVRETVLLGRTPYLNFLGRAGTQDERLVDLALERTALAGMAEKRVGELSGGEQQRVLLARALAQDTPLLALDEPTSHLDLQHQAALLNLVRRLSRQDGRAVLMVLHDLNLASIYADRIALLVDGRVLACGRPDGVLTASQLSHAYRAPVQVLTHPEYGVPLVLPDGFNRQ